MTGHFPRAKKTVAYRVLSAFVAFTFSFSYIVPPSSLCAQSLPTTIMNLPVPGTPVPLTPGFTSTRIIGMTIHADNPLMFDFMVDPGDMKLSDQQMQDESLKLVKYFLASLTVPAEKLWVNLSPYEKDKIVPQEFGQTEMGTELLAQDYMLKQLTASLMNPEDELGKKFWDRVYAKAQKMFGTTEIPLNTFNKVWIVPEKAVVYAKGLNVFVLESRFKVMMEEDYLALQHHSAENPKAKSDDVVSGVSSSIIKEVLMPEIEKEVNEGKTFANLRQIHNSLILAVWYKQNLKESLLGRIYTDKGKTGGLTVADKETSRKIYDQYVEAFQKGVHNFIKEDYDPATKEIIPRKYFSGGVTEANLEVTGTKSPGSKVLQTFAKESADASIISAGIESPGSEVSYKMSFAKVTPPASGEEVSSPVTISGWIEKTLAFPKSSEDNNQLPDDLRRAENTKRSYVIGGNLKMNLTPSATKKLIRDMAARIKNVVATSQTSWQALENMDIVIAPSYTSLSTARETINDVVREGFIPGGLFQLGAQDVSGEKPGAQTGEESVENLKELGVSYVILGHSERRHGPMQESSELVNRKAKRAIEGWLTPIIAIGETLEEYQDELTYRVISDQFYESTNSIDLQKIVVAYEPVWAIGTGLTPKPEDANRVQRFVRALAIEQSGFFAGASLPVQYGGSMNSKNVDSFIAQPSIDGGLIGGASLKAEDFIEIVTKSLEHYLSASSPVLALSIPVSTPESFANGLKARGFKVKGVEVAALKAQGGATVESVFSQPYVKDAVSVSLAQALGSILYAGQGTDAKVVADANAVWLGHESLIDMVTQNPNIAVASIASEGIRDGSVGTPLGRIYWSGYENKFRNSADKADYEAQITMLRQRGAQILYLLDDALENTNALKAEEALTQPTDSWSVTAFHLDDGVSPFRHMLDETNTRRLSVIANAPANAGITALDSPRTVLQKLAAAHGISQLDSQEGRAFAKKIIMAVLGERKKVDQKESSSQRHSFYIDGIRALEAEYGVRSMIFGDGDLMPGILAATGVNLDDNGSIVVKFGRSGLVEGEIMELGASQIDDAQFASRAVSKATTDLRVNPETVFNVPEGLLDRLVDQYGYSRDTFQVERTKEGRLRGKAVVAMTAVTGADPQRYLAGFAEQFKRVDFNDEEGTIALNTFLVTSGGVFAVRTTLESDNLPEAKASIRAASPEAKAYLAALESVRGLLNNLSEVLRVTPAGVEITDVQRFQATGLPYLVNEARYGKTKEVKTAARRLLREAGIFLGIKEASIHDFYIARQRDAWSHLTTPAFNVRTGPTMLTMEEIISAAVEKNVGPFILELAASEQRYTGQDASEYVAMAYAAAMSVGYRGLLFLQADHYQTDASFLKEQDPVKRAEKRLAAIKKVEKNIKDAVLAGKLNIDVDPSTAVRDEILEEVLKFEREKTTRYVINRMAVDTEFAARVNAADGLKEKPEEESEGIWSLRRKLVDDMEVGLSIEKYRNTLSAGEQFFLQEYGLIEVEQSEIRALYKQMHEETLALTKHYIAFIRKLEKELGLKQSISIGVEERHIDNKKHSKYPSTVLGSITIMNAVTSWSKENGYVPPSKLALQTGAMHGLGGTVDWGIFERHQLASELIGVSVFVQHGTSTLPPEEFANMPRVGSGEAHLATEYQKIVFRHIAENVPELRAKMVEYMEALINPELPEAQINADIAAKIKAEKLWEKRGEYKEKFGKKYADFMKSGLSRDEVIISMLSDEAPAGYEKFKGSVKDLTKELAGPFKKGVDNLPEPVTQAIRQELRAEFDRIYTVQNVVNSRALLDSIIPVNEVQVVLPPRSEMLQLVTASLPVTLDEAKKKQLLQSVKDWNRSLSERKAILRALIESDVSYKEIVNANPKDSAKILQDMESVLLELISSEKRLLEKLEATVSRPVTKSYTGGYWDMSYPSLGSVWVTAPNYYTEDEIVANPEYTAKKELIRRFEIQYRLATLESIINKKREATGLKKIEINMETSFNKEVIVNPRMKEEVLREFAGKLGIEEPSPDVIGKIMTIADAVALASSPVTSDQLYIYTEKDGTKHSFEYYPDYRMKPETFIFELFDTDGSRIGFEKFWSDATDLDKPGMTVEHTYRSDGTLWKVQRTQGNTIPEVKRIIEKQFASSSIADTEAQKPDKTGGIDLNPGNMDMQINNGADRIQLPMPNIPLENIKIDGLVPIIIRVAPVTNLPLLLGLADENEADDAAEFQPRQSPADAPRRLKAREVEEVGLLKI